MILRKGRGEEVEEGGVVSLSLSLDGREEQWWERKENSLVLGVDLLDGGGGGVLSREELGEGGHLGREGGRRVGGGVEGEERMVEWDEVGACCSWWREEKREISILLEVKSAPISALVILKRDSGPHPAGAAAAGNEARQVGSEHPRSRPKELKSSHFLAFLARC